MNIQEIQLNVVRAYIDWVRDLYASSLNLVERYRCAQDAN